MVSLFGSDQTNLWWERQVPQLGVARFRSANKAFLRAAIKFNIVGKNRFVGRFPEIFILKLFAL